MISVPEVSRTSAVTSCLRGIRPSKRRSTQRDEDLDNMQLFCVPRGVQIYNASLLRLHIHIYCNCMVYPLLNLFSIGMRVKHLVATFGPFVQLFINKTVVNEIQSNVTNANRTNAIDVMIEAQRRLSTRTVPEAHNARIHATRKKNYLMH